MWSWWSQSYVWLKLDLLNILTANPWNTDCYYGKYLFILTTFFFLFFLFFFSFVSFFFFTYHVPLALKVLHLWFDFLMIINHLPTHFVTYLSSAIPWCTTSIIMSFTIEEADLKLGQNLTWFITDKCQTTDPKTLTWTVIAAS